MPTYLIHKPYGVLSQFSREADNQQTLADFFKVEKDVYPVGRLDKDSEGLLVLSNDKRLTHRMLNPKFGHERTYHVQVEGIPDHAALEPLRNGITLRIDGKPFTTRPAKAHILQPQPEVPPRVPPIRYRANIPETWVEITLREGKNRQVRRMFAAIGFPVLRLIRVQIGDWTLGDMQPGDMIAIP
jgi:23S rRNA pseudouridine2457 synthase